VPWQNYTLEDFRGVHFLPVPAMGDWHFGLSLIETVPACALRKLAPYYHFGIIRLGKTVGYLNYRLGQSRLLTDYDGQIGYKVFTSHQGFGFAARACQLIKPLLRQHEQTSLIITCHPENIASIRTLERLGAEFIERCEFPTAPRGWDREKLRYRWHIDPAQ
jgi:predicted acetyltransferase